MRESLTCEMCWAASVRSAGGLASGNGVGECAEEQGRLGGADRGAHAGVCDCAGGGRPHRVAPAPAQPRASQPREEPVPPGAAPQ